MASGRRTGGRSPAPGHRTYTTDTNTTMSNDPETTTAGGPPAAAGSAARPPTHKLATGREVWIMHNGSGFFQVSYREGGGLTDAEWDECNNIMYGHR